ncbi:hypothetical protein ACODT5_02785 [Streptomyces sp. 5.8]|uniref:hypothetical protein n=1 Tax=Streptomyces sp. 5.8 TaxID=3406571 RepID=UPI003BB5A19F
MPTTTFAPGAAAELRAAIDFDSQYVVQVHTHDSWTRPGTVEHQVLHGVDVWHAIRRAPRYTAAARIGEHGILTLESATACMRFIPEQVYDDLFCSTEDCENSTAEGEGWEGRCGNCADRACAGESAGEDEAADTSGSATRPTGQPATDSAPLATPYSAADLRSAAATVHQMLLLALDAESGVGEGICDHTIPHTDGTATPRTWQSLGDERASSAYRAIRELLDNAPDLAPWAIAMADEHLVPDPETITRQKDGTPAVRLHLAFADHVTADQRAATHTALRRVLHTAV